MSSKQEEFKQRLAAVLGDIQQNGRDDPEAMWLIGSLAATLMEKLGSATWVDFKGALTQEMYSQLLTDFQTEGNRQYRDSNHKKAFAFQVLGLSLVAMTQRNAEIAPGEALLDQVIDANVASYRQSPDPKLSI